MDIMQYYLSNTSHIYQLTIEHLYIVTVSTVIAILIGLPAGILITKNEFIASKVINIANVAMTIPSIALFGFMLPFLAPFNLGLGKVPAIAALVIYSQLPIISNTYTAIKNVDPHIIDAGRGLGLSELRLFTNIKLPMSAPIILAGIRTAVIMNIGIASIAAYIGAGGLGVLIKVGIERVYTEMIITGALMVSLISLLIDWFMGGIEFLSTSKGLKVASRLRK